MDASGWNMWVFRDGRKTAKGEWLVDSLSRALVRAPEDLLSALLWAGELECALSDSTSPNELHAKQVTDDLAYALVVGALPDERKLVEKIGCIAIPGEVCVSVPESFAYYGLHPLRFADLATQASTAHKVRVVGIRSIGTTLSAAVAAGLRAKGVDVQRITVRPTGHPYDRELEFTREQRQWIREANDAYFLVVDEGPGLSGSSFLTTAEALERAGVANQRIALLGTSVPVPENLKATNGAQRWRRFRAEFVSGEPVLPEGADSPLGGGQWRSHFLREQELPGAWTQLEPRKYVSADMKKFFRFEGFGRYGAEVGERASRLAKFGFSPQYLGNVEGFGCYEFVNADPMTASAVSSEVIQRLAAYCAMRVREFATSLTDNPENENMLRHNWKTVFGTELGDESHLEVVHPVIADGRMLPYKWLRDSEGTIYKVDAVTHGDDHLAPGPCDIAWDLAGTIIEWKLSTEARNAFLAEYEKRSGDDARPRLSAYLLAYAMFRCAYSRLASQAMSGTEEELRLHRDYLWYRDQALGIRQSEFSRKSREVAKAEVG